MELKILQTFWIWSISCAIKFIEMITSFTFIQREMVWMHNKIHQTYMLVSLLSRQIQSPAQCCDAGKCVIVTSAWWALPFPPARCLSGSPHLCLQPTRLLLFPAQCYVLLSKYVRGWGDSVCTSVCQSTHFIPLELCKSQNLGQELLFQSHFQLLNMQFTSKDLRWIRLAA